MSTRFSRASALDWLHAQRASPVRVGAKGSALRVSGLCEGLEELDACSTEFTGCRIRLTDPHAEATLTLHDTAVSLLVLVRSAPGGAVELSIPVTIPYGDLVLETPGDSAAEDAVEEPADLVTPYRLLH